MADIVHTFITSDNMAVITCPKCQRRRNISVSKFKQQRHSIRVRCSCENVFIVKLDFRKHYRKTTLLPGTFILENPGIGAGRMMVQNISKTGIGFTFEKSGNLHVIHPKYRMKVSFHLDDKKQTQIEKIAVVHHVVDNYIGAEFTENQAFERDLGFYLRK